MREGWEEAGTCGYYTQAYGYVYLMQGAFCIINNGSAAFICLYSEGDSIYWTDILGLFVWLVGFAIEIAADT